MTCILDATPIATRLYQGSAPPAGSMVRQCGFDILVLTAEEYQPSRERFPGVQIVHLPMDDAPITEAMWRKSIHTASRLAKSIREGKKVLVTCAMGRNRSGLVVAITLFFLTGRGGPDIVHHVQSRRSGALTNPSFRYALENFLS